MKLSLILAALGAIPFAAAEAAAKGPFDAEYNKYCGNGKKEGIITAGGRSYVYHCNAGQDHQAGFQLFHVSSVEKCADVCSDNDDTCTDPTWDKVKGECWVGKPKGGLSNRPGRRIAMRVDANAGKLVKCQKDMQKWGPVDPVCPKNDLKPTEANGKKFVLACGQNIKGNQEQSGDFPAMKDCIKACANKSDCTSITYGSSSKRCYHATGAFLNYETVSDNTWHSAFRIN